MIFPLSARRRPPTAISMVVLTTALVTAIAPSAATATPAVVTASAASDRAPHHISRAQATKRALQVLGVKKSSDPVRVFALKAISKPGDQITQAGRSDGLRSARSTFSAPRVFQMKKRSYVFYADEAPHTLYQHRGRVVVVPQDGSAPTVRRTRFTPLVNGVAPSFLRSQKSYLSQPTVFSRDYSGGSAHSENRAAAPDAGAELAVAQTLAAQHTCVVRVASTGSSADVASRSTSAIGSVFTRLAARAPGLVHVTWSPRKSSASAFLSNLISDRGCRSVLVIAAGGGYVTGPPAVNLGTAVSGGRNAQVRVDNLTAADLSAVVARHPGVAVSLVLDAPYTGRFSKRLTAHANVEALLTPGGATRPAFGYLPGVRSGDSYLSNRANPRRLQETSNQIVTGLSQFVASADELRHYEKALSQGKARSLVSWMLVRASRLGSVNAIVPTIKRAPRPFAYSPVAVTAPVNSAPPSGPPTAEARTLTVDEDDSATVTFAGTDPKGKPVSFEIVDAPAHGVLATVQGGARYTPTADYAGSDSFTYRAVAEDGTTSAPAKVSVTVTPLNDGPVGGTFDTSVHENAASTTVAAPGLLADASDVDGDALAATPATGEGTAGGDFDIRANGSFDYDPRGAFDDLAAGAERVDTFAVTVKDPSGLSATVTIRVRVVGDNDAPKIDLDTTSAAYTEDGAEVVLASSLTITDVDNANVAAAKVAITGGESSDVLTWTVPTGSGITASYDAATRTLTASGTASKAAYRDLLRSVAFHTASDTPDESPRTVTFTVTDPADDDGTDALTLAVTAHDDPSEADADSVTVAEDSGTTEIDVLANDDDPDGNGPTVDSVTQPPAGEGTVTLSGGDVSYTPAANFNGSTSFTYTLTSGSTATVTVTVTAVNDAPTLGGGTGSANFTEDDATGVIVHSTVTVADVDNADLAGATVSIGTGLDATDDRLTFVDTANITGSYVAATGVLTLTGSDTKAAYQAALRSVRYKNIDTSDPSADTRMIGFQVSDGSSAHATSNAVTSHVTVTPVNDQPTITAGSSTASFTEGDAPVVVDSTVSVTDVDNANLAGASVQITSNFVSTEDVLAFVATADITGSYNSATGTLTLTGNASKAAYRDALRSVTYADTNTDNPSAATRTVSFRINDGDLASPTATSTVSVVAVNDAPVLAAGGNTVDFEEDDTSGVVVNNAITVADVDNANLAGATASITDNLVGAEDELRFTNTAEITGSYSATTGILTLAGTATKAQYQAALRTIRYRNNNTADPSPLPRKVSFRVNDGQSSSNQSNTVVTTANVNPHGDAPVVTAGSSTASFTEGGTPVVVDSTVGVTDVDNANLAGATVRITGNFVSAEDVLAFVATDDITGSYNAATGTLTLTGSATKADYRDALRSVAYENTNTGAPSTATRTVTFTATDGALTSDGATSTVAVVAVNSAPRLSQSSSAASYTEDGTPAVVAPNLVAADPDSVDLSGAVVKLTTNRESADRLGYTTVSGITGTYDDTTGILALEGDATVAQYQAALRSVTFRTVSDTPSTATRTLTIAVTDADGTDSNTLTRTITVAAANDAPVLVAGSQADATFTEGDATPATVDAGITVTDPDNADLQGATATLTTHAVLAEDELVYPATLHGVTGTYNASTGVLTLSGTATKAEYRDVLRSVKYRNSSTTPDVSTRTVEFQVTDASGGASNASSKDVAVAGLNEAPVLGGGGSIAYSENDAAKAISPALTVTDTDTVTFTGATVAITGNLSAGQDRLSFANAAPISGSYNAATGVLTLSGTGTVGEYQAALRAVKYDNTSDTPSTLTRTITYTVSDGELSDSETATVTVSAVNDAPVADDESFSGADAAIGNTSLVGDDATDGAPNPAGPQKTISANILGGDTDAEGDSLAVVPGTLASNDGGSVTVQADGDFTFTPAAGTSCSDHSDFFDYTVTDGVSPTPGTDTGRVTIAITDCVVYVDNAAATGGNGTSGTPYNTLAAADTAATRTGDYIYVYLGDGTTAGLTGGVSLLANQRLVGAAEDLTVAGTTLENGADANRPAISGGVTLGAGNTVEGLAITTTGANAINGGAGDASGTLDDLVLTPSGAAGAGVSLSGTSGTWNVSDITITATSGAQGIFVSSAGTVNFTSAGTISVTAAGPAFSAVSTAVSGVIDTTTSTGGSYGWATNAVIGSLDLGTGTISGHTSTEVSVTAGTGNVTYAGTIGNGTGTSAVIQNRTAGAVTLSGDITDSNDAGGGISMSGNSGGSTTFSGATKTINVSSGAAVAGAFTGNHTLSFTGGGLDIDAAGSSAGVALSGSNGTVIVSGSGNTIDTATGTPLSVNGPDIGATGVTLQRISSNGATNGILLSDTGTAGGLTVTGTGASASGGVIAASTGPGISLSNTRDISLSGVNVTNGGDDGIRASNVTNLAIAGNAGTGLASAITGNGNAGGENGFDLTELAGVVTINNATVTGNYDNNLALTNDAATLTNFTIDDGSYGTTNSTGGNDSIQIVNTGTGNLTGAIKNADFMNSRGDHIQLITDNDPTTTSTQKVTIQNNTLNSTALSSTVLGGGIALGVGGGATQTVLVDNNDIDHAHGAPMSFNTTTGTSPNANWTVNNNRIGNTGEVKSGSVANSGFYINVNGNGNAKFNLTNNTIMQTDFTAVDAVQNSGSAAMNITMKGNVITEPGTTIDYAYGLRFVIGSADGDAGTSCLDIGHPSTTALKNRFFGSGNSGQGYQDVRLRMAGDATVNLVGFTGGVHDNAAVNSWMQTRNNIGGTPTTSSSQFDADSFYGQAASCPLPSVP